MRRETTCCVIRDLEATDAASIARHLNDRAVWLGVGDRIVHPYSIDDAHAFLTLVKAEAPRVTFGLEVDGEIVGTIGAMLQGDLERGTAEIGYWVGQRHWGRGIGSAAVAAFVPYAFETYGLRRVFARCIANNRASMRVLEKCGFTQEGVMRDAVIKDGRVHDQVVYGITRAESLARA